MNTTSLPCSVYQPISYRFEEVIVLMGSPREVIGDYIRRIIAKEPFNNPPHPALDVEELSKFVALARSESVSDNIEAAKKIYNVVIQRSRRRRSDDNVGVENAAYEPLLNAEAIIEEYSLLSHSLAHLSSTAKSRIVVIYASKASKVMLRDLEVPDEAYAKLLPKALKEALERWSDDIPVAREVLGALQELCRYPSSAVEVVCCGGVCAILDLLDARDELSQTLATACIANLISQGRRCNTRTPAATEVLVDESFTSEIFEYVPDLLETAKEGVTSRIRLMARAVLVNASIHPTLTLSRNERKLGLEQLLHGFGGSGLRDQLNGIATPDCALLESKVTRTRRDGLLISTGSSEGLILHERGPDLEYGNMVDDSFSPQPYFVFGRASDRGPVIEEERQKRKRVSRIRITALIVVAVIVWVVVVIFVLIPALLNVL